MSATNGLLPSLIPLRRRLDDVRGYQLPRLQGCTNPSLARDLAAEARGDLEIVRVGLEDAREEVENLPQSAKLDAQKGCRAVEEDYHSVRSGFRAALVASKKAATAAAQKHELLDPLDGEAPKAEVTSAVDAGIGGDDALQTKTNEVTDALRRTTQTLQAELERSVLSVQMLDESTRTIRSTHALYDTYTSLVNTSAALVRALEKADWWDRFMILGALSFFLLVVGYIIKRRVLDRVGGAAVWWVGGSVKLIRKITGGTKAKEVAPVLIETMVPAVGGAAALAAKAAEDAAARAAKKGKKGTKEKNDKAKAEERARAERAKAETAHSEKVKADAASAQAHAATAQAEKAKEAAAEQAQPKAKEAAVADKPVPQQKPAAEPNPAAPDAAAAVGDDIAAKPAPNPAAVEGSLVDAILPEPAVADSAIGGANLRDEL